MSVFDKIKMCLFLLALYFSITDAQAENGQNPGTYTVTVTGSGATPSEARNDAVRQALQKTMQQLIVVDRVIENDTVVRDKIMSTMNGYIEGFNELKSSKLDSQFTIEALSNVCVGFRLNSGASWVFRSGRRASDGTSQISTAA